MLGCIIERIFNLTLMEKNVYKLYTDGSYIKHLAAASFGGYIVDPEDNIINEFSQVIENPEFFSLHESMAICEGLKIAIKNQIKNIICYSDCQTLCEILNKKDKETYIKRNIIIKEINNIISLFENINFVYIPRKYNKKAHQISQKIIKDNFLAKNLLVDNGIKIDNLYCTEQFLKEEKFKFNQIKNNLSDFLIFSLEQIENEQFIKIYISKKEGNTYTIKELKQKKTLKKNWQQQIIYIISDTISQFTTDHFVLELGLLIIGNNSRKIEHLLKGTAPVTKKTESALLHFKEAISSLEKLVIYKNFHIINLLFPRPSLGVIKNKYNGNLKDFYLYSLKELGSINYTMGQDPLIENHFDIKHKTPIELQKKFFGEFLKLNLIELQKLKLPLDNFNKEIYRKNVQEELLKIGVNFRY